MSPTFNKILALMTVLALATISAWAQNDQELNYDIVCTAEPSEAGQAPETGFRCFSELSCFALTLGLNHNFKDAGPSIMGAPVESLDRPSGERSPQPSTPLGLQRQFPNTNFKCVPTDEYLGY